jgi:hypothetical protein
MAASVTETLQTLKQAYADYAAALAADALDPDPSWKLEGEEEKRNEWRTSICEQMKCLREEILILEASLSGGPARVDVLVRRW